MQGDIENTRSENVRLKMELQRLSEQAETDASGGAFAAGNRASVVVGKSARKQQFQPVVTGGDDSLTSSEGLSPLMSARSPQVRPGGAGNLKATPSSKGRGAGNVSLAQLRSASSRGPKRAGAGASETDV
jgi:hypothetical protein